VEKERRLRPRRRRKCASQVYPSRKDRVREAQMRSRSRREGDAKKRCYLYSEEARERITSGVQLRRKAKKKVEGEKASHIKGIKTLRSLRGAQKERLCGSDQPNQCANLFLTTREEKGGTAEHKTHSIKKANSTMKEGREENLLNKRKASSSSPTRTKRRGGWATDTMSTKRGQKKE